jgi:hypothetical protein
MKAFWLNLFTLAFWLALVIWLIGCGHASLAVVPSHCQIVDRIESGGPGMPNWIVFEDNEPIPGRYFPNATEGSLICGGAL